MGWIGTILILVGFFLVGKKQRVGFAFGVIGNFFWILRSVSVGLADSALTSIIFLALNVYFWYQLDK